MTTPTMTMTIADLATALRALARRQRLGEKCALVHLGHLAPVAPEVLDGLGVNRRDLLIALPESHLEALEAVRAFAQTGAVDLVVLSGASFAVAGSSASSAALVACGLSGTDLVVAEAARA